MKTWNLGNTTVRSPERIADGLRVLRRFEGRVFDESTQLEYYEALRAQGFVGGDMEREGRELSGRKWASAANQMGFATALKRDPPVRLTPAGLVFLQGEPLSSETWLRQLLKVQLPPPLEPSRSKRYEGFSVHPFLMTLRATLALQDMGLGGLHREEIGLFIVTTIRDADLDEAVRACVEYRHKRQALTGSVARRELWKKSRAQKSAELYGDELEDRYAELRELVSSIRGNPEFLDTSQCRDALADVCRGGKGKETRSVATTRDHLLNMIRDGEDWPELAIVLAEHHLGGRANTLIDYADTTVRYCRMTGLFSLKGSLLVVSEDGQQLARQLVSQPAAVVPQSEFAEWFWSADSPSLPTDDADFLNEDLARLLTERATLELQLHLDLGPAKVAREPSMPALKIARASTRDEVAELREELFYRGQANCVPEILSGLSDVIEGDMGGSYRPAFLEWGVWRAFLATNRLACPVSDTRNFRVDADVNPIHTARGGVADMVFQYERHVLAVEVTLNTGPRQWSAEGEPVPRHVFQLMTAHRDCCVLGLFLAPKIDPQTANQFLTQVWWDDEQDENVPVDLVPLTMLQFMTLLEAWGPNLTPVRLHGLLDACLACRATSSHGPEWLKQIAAEVAAQVAVAAAS